VITEASYLLNRYDSNLVHHLLAACRDGVYALLPLDKHDIEQIDRLIAKYQDLCLDFADAALMRLAEREGIEQMKRITRNRLLTPEEAAKYQAVRKQVADELPDLVARHQERMASLDQLEKLFTQLKAAREAKGLSLADVTEMTGMDRSALSKLETGQRANPTVETLVRYAEAVGKRLVVTLTDVTG
jgi:predicted nucleic acid-binding protein